MTAYKKLKQLLDESPRWHESGSEPGLYFSDKYGEPAVRISEHVNGDCVALGVSIGSWGFTFDGIEVRDAGLVYLTKGDRWVCNFNL